ncbi:MAG: helix-turn-helix domain-containing protein [Chlorobiaceae bacterium]|nr:helix-turn-helix domain-containing protein [Chlorobiaceae bacterium]
MADETPSGGPLVQLTLALKNERVGRGLSVEDIARMVNIGAFHIERLETGDFSYLPPIYVFSYLRKYATELGVGDESLLASCRKELLLPESRHSGSTSTQDAAPRAGGSGGRRKLLIFSSLIILLLAIMLFSRIF